MIEIRKRVLGDEHPQTLTSMQNLALVWKDQSRDTEAIQLMAQCVRLSTRTLDADYPHTLLSSEKLMKWQSQGLNMYVESKILPIIEFSMIHLMTA